MILHPRAGQPAEPSDCINIEQLVTQYYNRKPLVDDPQQAVHFGTSGHRGSAETGSFNEAHLLAIAQAIVEVRASRGIKGCCFIGKDTHALSEPAFISVLEVLTANNVPVVIASDGGFTPTPAISHAILCHNRTDQALADGIIITPSHNPPQDGGIKYNLPNGGPAGNEVTRAIQCRANALIAGGLRDVKRQSWVQAVQQGLIHQQDLLQHYVADLGNVVDMPAIQRAGLKLGVDPLGGAGVAYWQRISDLYRLDLTLVNPTIDPTFSFMALDSDGVIRMDCASRYTMAPLLAKRTLFDLCLASDTDHDRHGIVTPAGLMPANHYLAVAIDHLLRHRAQWPRQVAIGTTVVSSLMIERVARRLNHAVVEVPVGFKGFVEGLYQGNLGFAGEESAGASFLRFNGRPWSTDKDGIILGLLAAEIMAVTGEDPHQRYQQLLQQLGPCSYNRLQLPLTATQKNTLLIRLAMIDTPLSQLAGDTVTAWFTQLPSSGAAIGGVKVISDRGWFAIRPSGTEPLCKIHCESLVDTPHRQRIEQDALNLVEALL